MDASRVTLSDLRSAREKIFHICIRTPLIYSVALSEKVGAQIFLKLESVQPTGSYKVRGAANKLLNLSPDQKNRGVVAYSTGNHGLAVAYVAKQLGIRAVICVSERVSVDRLEAIRRFDAEVLIRGEDQDHAGLYARQLQKEQGLEFVHPFDDPYVIAGQGTIGLEIAEDIAGLGSVIVPLAGGGLASGVALALKSENPDIGVIGVSARNLPSMVHSLEAGKPVDVEESESVARSLEGEIGTSNRHTFTMVKQLVDQTLLVTEEEIEGAIDFLLFRDRLIVEGASAAAVAGILEKRVENPGVSTVVVISGGNLDQDLFLQAVKRILDQAS
jgi:threonine dehydratase